MRLHGMQASRDQQAPHAPPHASGGELLHSLSLSATHSSECVCLCNNKNFVAAVDETKIELLKMLRVRRTSLHRPRYYRKMPLAAVVVQSTGPAKKGAVTSLFALVHNHISR